MYSYGKVDIDNVYYTKETDFNLNQYDYYKPILNISSVKMLNWEDGFSNHVTSGGIIKNAVKKYKSYVKNISTSSYLNWVCGNKYDIPVGTDEEYGWTGDTWKDVVEFTKDDINGISVPGKRGKWSPVIVEFKRGKQKKDLRDIVQLVAEVICLEEKLNIKIPKSYLYYNQTNKKIEVDITEELRNLVFHLSNEMHHLYEQNITTPAEISKNCKECSLVDICMPRITKKKVSIANYMSQRLDEDLT